MLCTIATGPHRELYKVARPGFERFADAHGYQLIVGHDDDASAGRPQAWGKVRLLLRLLDSHDRAVWVDSDAVIVDPYGDIFEGLNRRAPLALAIHHYDGLEVPNSGVMALLSCRWSKRLLDWLWASDQFVDHKWWENAALLDLLGYEIEEPRRLTRRPSSDVRRIRELDLSWNSIAADPSPHPRIAHFPGMGQSERLIAMKAALVASEAGPRD